MSKAIKVVTMVATIVMAICAVINLQPNKSEVSNPQLLPEVTITNIITIDATEGVQIDNEVNNID